MQTFEHEWTVAQDRIAVARTRVAAAERELWAAMTEEMEAQRAADQAEDDDQRAVVERHAPLAGRLAAREAP